MKFIYCLLTSVVLPLLFLTSCNSVQKQERILNELMEVDREFSDLSLKAGSHESFLAYIDDSCILLRPNRNPVIGRKKIEEMYSKPDTSFALSWEPLSADVSCSGDLGYTYGIYTVRMDSPEGIAVTKKGTYVTIWKKDKNGNWKFVLDTGNQGLGNDNETAE
jgi:ketosteroid isomerase-like protein